MLSVKEVNIYYGKLQALWDVSIDIQEGEIVGLLGANGAGKTSLLKAICGVIKPATGEINFDGKNIKGMAPHCISNLGISLVPEGGRIFPNMTVRENLEMGAYPKEVWDNRDEMFENVYNIFPILKDRKKQLANTLSGGERQILAMGRCLMAQPKLCIFDEMSYGLAPQIVEKVFNTIERLNNEGITVLLIEQNVKDTLEIADRAYVIESGKITMEGSCNKLKENDYIKKSYLGI